MVLDVSFIVSPQALPRGGVEQEGKGLERDGDADVQVSVGHIVVEGAGALLPTERAPEQAGGVDAGPEDERRGDEACRGKDSYCSGSGGWSGGDRAPRVCLRVSSYGIPGFVGHIQWVYSTVGEGPRPEVELLGFKPHLCLLLHKPVHTI